MTLPVDLWPVQSSTGWGLFGAHLALGLARAGRKVYLPGNSEIDGFPVTLQPSLRAMMESGGNEHRLAIIPYGLHWPKYQPLPNRTQVLIYMAEDSAIPDHAIEEIRKYPLVLAPSTWAQGQLAKHGISATRWLQGADSSTFTPAPKRRPPGPLYVFSGGKLEQRKGQDIVIEAFRRFRETPEGKDAVLVTAWQNHWIATMNGIWESGYVKGVPVKRDGQLDIVSWCEANGLPRGSVIDLGFLSQAEMANAIRECDVGLFPNRCECATSMPLCEALFSGLPCIVSQNTGHLDVKSDLIWKLCRQSPVTIPTPIYQGTDGWGESDIAEVVTALNNARHLSTWTSGEWGRVAAQRYGWHARASELHTLLQRFDSTNIAA